MGTKWDFCELPKDAKVVPDTNDKYYADTLGNIYSKYKNSGYVRLHTQITKLGYVQCYIGLVHHLTALAFIPNPENKPEVNHKDGNKLNNNVENLEWSTRSENIQHAYDNGLKRVTEEHKRKISVANKGKYVKPVKVIFNDNTELIFNSRTECADYLKVDRGDLSRYILGKKKAPKRCNVKEVFYIGGK